MAGCCGAAVGRMKRATVIWRSPPHEWKGSVWSSLKALLSFLISGMDALCGDLLPELLCWLSLLIFHSKKNKLCGKWQLCGSDLGRWGVHPGKSILARGDKRLYLSFPFPLFQLPSSHVMQAYTLWDVVQLLVLHLFLGSHWIQGKEACPLWLIGL